MSMSFKFPVHKWMLFGSNESNIKCEEIKKQKSLLNVIAKTHYKNTK